MRLRVLVPGTDSARGLEGNDNGGAFRLETVLPLRGGRRLHAFEDKVMHLAFAKMTDAIGIGPHMPVMKDWRWVFGSIGWRWQAQGDNEGKH